MVEGLPGAGPPTRPCPVPARSSSGGRSASRCERRQKLQLKQPRRGATKAAATAHTTAREENCCLATALTAARERSCKGNKQQRQQHAQLLEREAAEAASSSGKELLQVQAARKRCPCCRFGLLYGCRCFLLLRHRREVQLELRARPQSTREVRLLMSATNELPRPA